MEYTPRDIIAVIQRHDPSYRPYTIYEDLDCGELKAIRNPRKKRGHYKISTLEAGRYVEAVLRLQPGEGLDLLKTEGARHE